MCTDTPKGIASVPSFQDDGQGWVLDLEGTWPQVEGDDTTFSASWGFESLGKDPKSPARVQ